jgi:glycine dehydrogenase subunit 2
MSETRTARQSTRQQARWNEPIIMELGSDGERGILVPEAGPEITAAVGDGVSALPDSLRRRHPLALPEISQPQVVRHYLRLSQETPGHDVNVDLGLGTCTMKYSPKAHERFVRAPEVADLHPRQDAESVQGLLGILHEFEQMLGELSGMARFSFQPGGGAQGIYANACMARSYHAGRGDDRRDEVITTIFSHPADAACPATAGYKVITLYPGERGYPDVDALKAVLSERTAALMITNPEDTGLFNPHIDEFVELVHDAGGLCAYDQANANGILGVTRARDAGFDLCQFNLHKTFSSPHGSLGMACGAVGASEELERFLPVPRVERDPVSGKLVLDYDRPDTIGKVRAFHGVVATVVRAYAWMLTMGPEGLRTAAETAVLNNNYLRRRLLEIPGLTVSFEDANPQPRLEQIRYSWAGLADETGVGTDDIGRRTADFGLSVYHTSHHPWLVPEPATPEPTESFARRELDDYADTLALIAREARDQPDTVREAPHRAAVHRVLAEALEDPARWAATWRAHRRKNGGGRADVSPSGHGSTR